MKRTGFFLLLVSCIMMGGSIVLAQGREWQRIRTTTHEEKIRTDVDAATEEKRWERVKDATEEIKIRIGTETTVSGEARPSVDYFIAGGDVLQIFIWQNPDVRITMVPAEEVSESKEVSFQAEYLITPGDVIEIFVWQNPDLTRTITVGPDGKISHPLVGRIQASDLSIGELEERIKQELSKYIRYPEVSVLISKFMGDEVMVLEREVTVDPDGTISYPLVGRIEAVGLSIRQLEEKVKESLPSYLKYSQASVVVKKPTGNKIIVLGEVLFPGVYTYTGSIDLVEAVALAGDFTDDAKERSVMIVRGASSGSPEVRRVNVARVLRRGAPGEDFSLEANDIVYVPKTFIADFNKFLADISPTLSTASSVMDVRKEIRRWTYK